MDFFMNNIPDNKSSLRGYDAPKSVIKAKGMKGTTNTSLLEGGIAPDEQLVNKLRTANINRYY